MDRTGFRVGAALAALFLVLGIAGAVVALQGGGNSTPLPPSPAPGPSQPAPSGPATP